MSAIITVRGKRACTCWAAIIEMIEERLIEAGVIKRDLTGCVTQGSYNTSVKASGSTHAGGGVWDVIWAMVATKEGRLAWRNSGVAMWRRWAIPLVWAAHGHGVIIGCPHLSASAKRQVDQYRLGLNGLTSRAKDQDERVPVVTWETALDIWKGKKNPIAKPAPVSSAKRVLEDGILGPQTVRAIQNDLRNRYGASGLNGKQLTIDGIWGKQTIAALQRVIQYKMPKGWATWRITGQWHRDWIKRLQWLVGMPQAQLDGILGRQTVLAIQKKINNGGI